MSMLSASSKTPDIARLKPLLIPKCPFANLPETHEGRWGEGLTAADMEKCVWVRPEIVARIEFLAELSQLSPSRPVKRFGISRGW